MERSIFFSLLLVASIFSSCKDKNTNSLLEANSSQVLTCNLENPSDSITNEEVEMLKFMREEEKLARDVYRYLYKKYALKVFNNIANSEDTHMGEILCLLNQYHISDPASIEEGVFNNQAIQVLYNQLIEQGNISLTEALKVGATIEDVDIRDLMESRAKTSQLSLIFLID